MINLHKLQRRQNPNKQFDEVKIIEILLQTDVILD